MYSFAAAQQATTGKLLGFFQKSLKTVHALKVNGAKGTSRNIFINHLFTLKSEKESEKSERTFFSVYPRILDLTVDP